MLDCCRNHVYLNLLSKGKDVMGGYDVIGGNDVIGGFIMRPDEKSIYFSKWGRSFYLEIDTSLHTSLPPWSIRKKIYKNIIFGRYAKVNNKYYFMVEMPRIYR